MDCKDCGDVYTHAMPCQCAWRRRHYEQMRRLREAERRGVSGSERYALIRAIKQNTRYDR